MVKYFTSRAHVGWVREVNEDVQDRIRSFLGPPIDLGPITTPIKEG